MNKMFKKSKISDIINGMFHEVSNHKVRSNLYILWGKTPFDTNIITFRKHGFHISVHADINYKVVCSKNKTERMLEQRSGRIAVSKSIGI